MDVDRAFTIKFTPKRSAVNGVVIAERTVMSISFTRNARPQLDQPWGVGDFLVARIRRLVRQAQLLQSPGVSADVRRGVARPGRFKCGSHKGLRGI